MLLLDQLPKTRAALGASDPRVGDGACRRIELRQLQFRGEGCCIEGQRTIEIHEPRPAVAQLERELVALDYALEVVAEDRKHDPAARVGCVPVDVEPVGVA